MHFVNKQQASASESKTAVFCVSSARSKRKSFIIFENYYIQWLLLLFFIPSSSGSDDIVLSEAVLICKCFMRYYNFVHKLNSKLRMETRLA